MSETLQKVRMSLLPDATNPKADSRFLIIENNGSSSWRNATLEFSKIAASIDASVVTAAKNEAITRAVSLAKEYTDAKSSSDREEIDSIIRAQTTRIDNILAGSTDLTKTLIGAYNAAVQQADSKDTTLRNTITDELTNVIDAISTDITSNITPAGIAVVDSKINDICANISGDIEHLSIEFTNVSSTVYAVSNDVSTAYLLKTKFESIDSAITDLTSTPADSDKLGMIKIGYANDPDNYNWGVRLDENNNAYVYVPDSGGSGGGLPAEWDDVKSYSNALKTRLGPNFEQYSADITKNDEIIIKLNSKFSYYDNESTVSYEYDLVRIDKAYTAFYLDEYYVATNIIDSSDQNNPNARYLEIILTNKIIAAKSVDLDSNTYVDTNDRTCNISELTKYDIIVDENSDDIYIVKTDNSHTTPYAVLATVHNAIMVTDPEIIDSENTKYKKYVIEDYSVTDIALNTLKIKYSINDIVHDIADEIVEDSIELSLNEFYSELVILQTTKNSSSIEILANSIKNIAIPLADFDNSNLYTPISIKNIDINNNDVYIAFASTFNNEVHIMLLNMTNDDIILNENDIEITIFYIAINHTN